MKIPHAALGLMDLIWMKYLIWEEFEWWIMAIILEYLKSTTINIKLHKLTWNGFAIHLIFIQSIKSRNLKSINPNTTSIQFTIHKLNENDYGGCNSSFQKWLRTKIRLEVNELSQHGNLVFHIQNHRVRAELKHIQNFLLPELKPELSSTIIHELLANFNILLI